MRGLGPPRRAAALGLDTLRAQGAQVQLTVADAPRDIGAFVVVAVWWLLREIEASALVMSSVLVQQSTGVVSLALGATKNDIRGQGAVRSHRCICQVAPSWAALCPACTLRAQQGRRRREGAEESDPLFPGAAAGVCSKQGTVTVLRSLFRPEGAGAVSGHSMRRTGAQMLSAGGVEPWVVEWFGRWGSAAVRAYVEDARARAPAGSGLALAVAAAAVAGGSGRPPEPAEAECRGPPPSGGGHAPLSLAGAATGDVAQVMAEIMLLREQFGEGAGPAPGAAAPEGVIAVHNSLGKAHAARAAVARGPLSGRVALCGWHFGRCLSALLSVGPLAEVAGADLCRRCSRSLLLAEGHTVEGQRTAAQLAAAAEGAVAAEASSSGSSSPSGRSGAAASAASSDADE